MFQGQPPFNNDRYGKRSSTANDDWRVFSTKTILLISFHTTLRPRAPTVLYLPIMSQNTTLSQNTTSTMDPYQDDDDTVPLLSRGHTRDTARSTLSRLSCKVRRKPDNITVKNQLTKWSQRGTDYLEGAIVRDTVASHPVLSRAHS